MTQREEELTAVLSKFRDDVEVVVLHDPEYGDCTDIGMTVGELRALVATPKPEAADAQSPHHHLMGDYIHDLRAALAPFAESSSRYSSHGALDEVSCECRVADLRIAKATFDAKPPIAEPLSSQMVNAAWNEGKRRGMTGLPSDFRAILNSALAPLTSELNHRDDIAVDRFAAAMKAKLAKKRAEGRSGWDNPEECSIAFLSELLREHVDKGDPVDVGNLAMMIHQREGTIE